MKIHNRGKIHQYSICGCQVKNFQICLPIQHKWLFRKRGRWRLVLSPPLGAESRQFWSAEHSKYLVPPPSNFTATVAERRFRKISTSIFKFGCFSRCHLIFEKKKKDWRISLCETKLFPTCDTICYMFLANSIKLPVFAIKTLLIIN